MSIEWLTHLILSLMKKLILTIFITLFSILASLGQNIAELKQKAEQGDADAQNNLGYCYAKGDGVEKDLREAVKWYRKSAEQGDADAQYNLALCYHKGYGAEKDLREAVKWYRKSAEQGDALAQYNLGLCYFNGDGVEKDLREAVKWLCKSAEQGHVKAQYFLALCYDGGYGVEKNPREAVKWYRKAAEQGHAKAQYYLALCYDNGEGVEKDLREAVKWYRKAAEQGHADAQRNLALCYYKGEGVEKDLREAVKWFRKAAEQGHAKAQYNLGLCYYKGYGVIQNNVKAYAWLALASANGNEEAKTFMDILKKEMPASQIQHALKLAENYEKGIFDETPKKENSTKTGSGFAITSNGFIITNYHVVADSTKVKVIKNGIEYSATVVASDTSNDIAILKISQATKPLSLITSRKVKIGNNVYSMGFPNVQLQGISPKFTSGVISSLTGLQDDPKHFQISVPVQPGNSGGALVDEKGNVVGIVTAKLSQKVAISTTGTIAENVNYALKSSYVLIMLESMPNISDNLEDESRKKLSSESIAEKLKDSTYFIIAN